MKLTMTEEDYTAETRGPLRNYCSLTRAALYYCIATTATWLGLR